MGGYGMAGGAWILTGLGGAAVTTAGAGTRTLLKAIPTEALRLEVGKAQTTAVLRMENGSWTREDVAERIRSFDDFDHELQAELARGNEAERPRCGANSYGGGEEEDPQGRARLDCGADGIVDHVGPLYAPT